MEELLKELWAIALPAILNIAGAILMFILSWVGLQVKRLLNTQLKRDIAKSAVQFAEQVGIALGGPAKFELAKTEALKMLADVGIKISDDELKVLIEQMVQAFYGHNKEVIVPLEEGK